jgi:protein-S-isoprenylcysteine O-methyltransferase Ste14
MELWRDMITIAQREYSARARLAAIGCEALVFVVAIPALLYWLSTLGGDRWRFRSSHAFLVVCLILAVLGLSLALWTVWTQHRHARGTPVPIMATKKLLTTGPYSLCRNPMLLGTILYYAGISTWTTSFIAMLGTVLFTILMIIFVKLVEEKEMLMRFGDEYSGYVRRTPFIVPRLIFPGRRPRP